MKATALVLHGTALMAVAAMYQMGFTFILLGLMISRGIIPIVEQLL
jgi:hypothetical protein